MRLTLHSDYALRVLLYVAAKGDGHTSTIAEMAERYAISKNHLMKVVQKLTKSGFLTAIRGRSGGVVLGCAADRIRLGDVLRVMEEDFNIVECFAALVPDAASAADKTQGACVITAPCKLKHILHAALQAFLDVMDSYTLADLNVRNENLLAALQLDEYV